MFTPRRDTMHLRNKTVVRALIVALTCAGFAFAQKQPQAPSSPTKVQPTALPSDVDPNDPAVPVWARPAGSTASAQPPAAANTPNPTKPGTLPPDLSHEDGTVGAVTKGDKGGFVYRQQVEEVTLQATVVDHQHRIVTDLGQRDFTVYEDGQPQPITLFRREDVPVSIGILVDNSGSMRTKRNGVPKAVVNLVQAS